ncbi:MAG: hypothetical protein NUV74_09575 [Candidatus Brocadiaceae bacterium]|nr:hypothetical protein [Candidatus Brocadiaceae bacterium]
MARKKYIICHCGNGWLNDAYKHLKGISVLEYETKKGKGEIDSESFIKGNSSAHRKGAKDALPPCPPPEGEKGGGMIKNFKEGLSSTIKSQGFSEIFSMYFPKNNTFAHFAPLR